MTRPFRFSIITLASAVLVIGASLAAGPRASGPRDDVRVDSVGAIGFTVSDADRAVDFFTGVLAFEKMSDLVIEGGDYERLEGVAGLKMRVVTMRVGTETIELTEYRSPRGRAIPTDARSNDRSFQHIAIVVKDMDAAYRVLQDHGVIPVSTAPQTLPDWNPNAGGIRAFYFRDPDGHVLEIIWFPPGKGDPRWQQPSDRLFLGIDHSAIVVESTTSSLAFYRDELGFRIAGESENYGIEQERLNNVSGAHLRITGLRTRAGPGIEFLEYLAPTDGRDMPYDVHSNDLAHWETTLVAPNAAALTSALLAAQYRVTSSNLVAIPDRRLGFAAAALVRDPDGHVMRIVQR